MFRLVVYVVWIGFYFKGESKNARAKVHSDGTVAGALVVDASAYEDSCLVPTIRYLRYRRYLRYGGDKICGADGAAAREPGTIYGTHAAFSYALNRGAMHCAAG